MWSLDLVWVVVVGLVGIWFAYPTVFILSGAFVALAVRGYRVSGARGLVPLVFIGVGWLATFGALHGHEENTSKIQAALFGPTDTHDTAGIRSTVHAAWSGFVDPARFAHWANGAAVVMFCFGVYSLVRRVDLARARASDRPARRGVHGGLSRPVPARRPLLALPRSHRAMLVSRGVQEIAERYRARSSSSSRCRSLSSSSSRRSRPQGRT